eukprot:6191168-Pleurochrysis_carterae.AAC.3
MATQPRGPGGSSAAALERRRCAILRAAMWGLTGAALGANVKHRVFFADSFCFERVSNTF